MPIREFFHLLHIVDDFDGAEARFDAVFAPHAYATKHWSDFDKRWASLTVIGPDFVLELAEPGHTDADRASPLPKFHARHGEHLHSFAWFVDPSDVGPMVDRLRDGGIRVIEPYGEPTGEGPGDPRARTFFTHPKDTFGQLEFQSRSAGGKRHRDPHLADDWSGASWRDEHPLGLVRLSHLTTVVPDLDRACALYDHLLDAPVFHAETTADRRSAFVFVGTETVVELAEPLSGDSRLGRDLAAHGALPHAMTFEVADLDAAGLHVERCGVRVAGRTGDSLTLEPADMCNAVVAFTTRTLPGDPRP